MADDPIPTEFMLGVWNARDNTNYRKLDEELREYLDREHELDRRAQRQLEGYDDDTEG